MPVDWGSYDIQLRRHGDTQRDRLLSYQREALLKKMRTSPAMKQVDIGNVPVDMLMLSTDYENEKRFQLLPGDMVNIGDIVLWNEMHWLVTQVDFDDELTRSGRIVQCNRQIRWQNPETREIIERWCLMTKPYSSNVKEGITVASSNREFKVQVPYDEETRLVDLDKRFMLETIGGKPRTYTCRSVDQQTNKYQDIEGGFIVWNLEQDEAGRQNDRTDLMICDYLPVTNEEDVPNEPSPLLLCEISGPPVIRAGTAARTYKGVFYLEDGVSVAEDVSAAWSVTVPAGYESHISWELSDAVLRLSADQNAVGQTLILKLVDDAGAYGESVFEVEVTSLL